MDNSLSRVAAEQVHSDEVGREPRARMTAYVRRRPLLDDVSILENHQPVGERHGVHRVVGHQHTGRAAVAQLPADLAPQRGASARIDGRQRFVQKEKSR